MNWTIVGPTFPSKGGIALHTTALAHRMAERGEDVTLEAWLHQYPHSLYPGVQYLEQPEGTSFPDVSRRLTWYRPDTWWRVGRQAGQTSDAIVVALVSPVQFPAYDTLVRAAHRSGTPVVAIAHNVLPHEPNRLDRYLASRLYRRLDALLVHSEAEAELARSFGVERVGVSSLPFFFDAPPPADRPAGARGQIAFVGFVRPYKGLDVLLEALARTDSRPRLTIHGEFWDDVDTYVDQARRLGIDGLCEFVPGYATSAELAATIDAADALVAPYRSATGTQHPRIARSRGRPCIATDVSAMRDQIAEGVDGFVVAPGDPDALAEAIDRLYEGDTLEQLARSVRPVDADQEWQRYIDELASLVRRCPPAMATPRAADTPAPAAAAPNHLAGTAAVSSATLTPDPLDNVAGNTYDKYSTTNPLERRMVTGFFDALESMLPAAAPGIVLEAGTGEGQIIRRLVDRWPNSLVVGLDLEGEELADNWTSIEAPMLAGDAMRLPFPDASIDLVIGLEMLEHVQHPERALAEFARVCAGSVVLSVPREPIWRIGNTARGRYLSDFGNTPGHLNHWSARSFVSFVGTEFEIMNTAKPLPWTMIAATPRR